MYNKSFQKNKGSGTLLLPNENICHSFNPGLKIRRTISDHDNGRVPECFLTAQILICKSHMRAVTIFRKTRRR
jgi:hypothetical protein